MPLVERRYAEALVQISAQAGAIDEYQRDFEAVVNIFNTQPDFKYFVLNPEVKTEVKKEVLKKLLENQVNPVLVNFFMLLLEKGRIKQLPGILDEYVRLADRKRNILNMTIISAIPLSEEQINKIKDKYTGIYGAAAATVNVSVDAGLIGGVKVVIGDKVIDGSVKGRLESLKAVIAK